MGRLTLALWLVGAVVLTSFVSGCSTSSDPPGYTKADMARVPAPKGYGPPGAPSTPTNKAQGSESWSMKYPGRTM
jgi:hypothetical protein